MTATGDTNPYRVYQVTWVILLTLFYLLPS